MKASESEIRQALDRADPAIRLFLLHGPDESVGRALLARFVRARGPAAERIDLDSATLKADPARLADEAASISMFGDRRYIVLTLDAAEAAMDAIRALLQAPVAGNPVIALAGPLRGTHALVKLATADSACLVFACYPAEGRQATDLAAGMAREQGLRLTGAIAQQIVDRCGGDRGLMAQEVEKLALFLDAAPERPRDADAESYRAIAAGEGDADLSGVVDAALDGDGAALAVELARLAAVGVEGIPVIRAALRRVNMLVPLASEIARGRGLAEVMASDGKYIFFKEKPVISRQLRRWNAARLARVHSRLVRAERDVKAAGSIGPIAAEEALAAIARLGTRAN